MNTDGGMEEVIRLVTTALDNARREVVTDKRSAEVWFATVAVEFTRLLLLLPHASAGAALSDIAAAVGVSAGPATQPGALH